MQAVLNISVEDVIGILGRMNLDEMEKVKDAIIRREVYFKKYKKDKIGDGKESICGKQGRIR